jgi:hypothetical protein
MMSRRFTTTILILWGSIASVANTWAQSPVGCSGTDEAMLWVSPRAPEPGDPIKIKGVSTAGDADELVLIDAQGVERSLKSHPRGGPPWSLTAELERWSSNDRIEMRHHGATLACASIADASTVSVSHGWTRPVEAFYAAWVEELFDAPIEQNLSFKSLEPVIRSPERNFLHGHLGNQEDSRLPADPDCADLPYYLRTYFAWKIGLPVSFRACDRGTSGRAPNCGAPTLDDRFTRGIGSQASFTSLMRQIANVVHSGSARTDLEAERTDFYPVPLEREALWPGTVYADPYGHTLIIAKWLPQSDSASGVLLAADAQPDNSVARKRFWEGNFLFANVASAGPGFKQFRPILNRGGDFEILTNKALLNEGSVAPYSQEQESLDDEAFYARVGKVINPEGLAPTQAYLQMLEALMEQLETRVVSVDTGERYMNQHRGSVITMPSGAGIFEAMGPWEDYATPSRDMRLLIAIKVISALPHQILIHPELFKLNGQSPNEAKDEVEQLLQQSLSERHINYLRSDGSTWALSLADVFNRRQAFEIGYNPNDCVEVRWGAAPSSEEAQTCTRRAPPDQAAKLQQYRPWFSHTQRPSR